MRYGVHGIKKNKGEIQSVWQRPKEIVFGVVPLQIPFMYQSQGGRETPWRIQAQPQQFCFPTTLAHTKSHERTIRAKRPQSRLMCFLRTLFRFTFIFSVFFSLPSTSLIVSSVCVCVCIVLFLPHLLSLWCAWWFNIANWCQTTKLYSLFTVLSLFWLSLYLSLPSFPSLPCLLLYSLICSGGLVARLQDFHITSFFCCQRIYFCFFPIALFALGPLKLWIYLIIYSFLDFLRNCLHSSAWVTRICIRTLFYL